MRPSWFVKTWWGIREDMAVSIKGVRHWCDSVEETFSPRLQEDIPRGEPQRQVPETFLAHAFQLMRAMATELEGHTMSPEEAGRKTRDVLLEFFDSPPDEGGGD